MMSRQNIPNFFNTQFVDRSGYLTNEWANNLQQLFSALQTILSPEGYKLPQQTAANIEKLNTQQSVGALIYNSDTKQVMINIDGTFKAITTD